MAKLTLQDMTVQALQGRAAKKAPTSTAAISDSQTSKLYSIVAGKGLVAGDTPRTTQETASAVLESIGCTIASSTKYPKDFSLERTQIQEPLENKNIVGYGATAKSATLINYCGISRDHIDYICDSTVAKQGLFSPGAHIPVISQKDFFNNYPDYTLLFAWNHKKEILKKEKSYTDQGGKWIEYIPKINIL